MGNQCKAENKKNTDANNNKNNGAAGGDLINFKGIYFNDEPG